MLERRGATVAVVDFSGRAGHGRETGRIALYCADGDQLIDIQRWSFDRDELTLALEAPGWERCGTFAGQPASAGP